MDSQLSRLTTRAAARQDADLLAAFGAQTFFETFAEDNTPEDMAAYLQNSFSPDKQAAQIAAPGALFLIAEIDGQPCGYALLREGPLPDCVTGARAVEIGRFYVGKAWIGKGVAGKLMTACLQAAVERQCDTVWLDVWEKNPRAIAFYRKWGFAVVGTQPFQLGSDLQTDLLMARSVSV